MIDSTLISNGWSAIETTNLKHLISDNRFANLNQYLLNGNQLSVLKVVIWRKGLVVFIVKNDSISQLHVKK